MNENAKNNGGPAFPTENERQTGPSSFHHEGMTLRDYFAAKAMQACLVNHAWDMDGLANMSYKMADAMLKAREM